MHLMGHDCSVREDADVWGLEGESHPAQPRGAWDGLPQGRCTLCAGVGRQENVSAQRITHVLMAAVADGRGAGEKRPKSERAVSADFTSLRPTACGGAPLSVPGSQTRRRDPGSTITPHPARQHVQTPSPSTSTPISGRSVCSTHGALSALPERQPLKGGVHACLSVSAPDPRAAHGAEPTRLWRVHGAGAVHTPHAWACGGRALGGWAPASPWRRIPDSSPSHSQSRTKRRPCCESLVRLLGPRRPFSVSCCRWRRTS